MQSEEQENQQELHSYCATTDELVMTEEIKQVLDEKSKEIWKEIEKKLREDFDKEYTNYLLKTFRENLK